VAPAINKQMRPLDLLCSFRQSTEGPFLSVRRWMCSDITNANEKNCDEAENLAESKLSDINGVKVYMALQEQTTSQLLMVRESICKLEDALQTAKDSDASTVPFAQLDAAQCWQQNTLDWLVSIEHLLRRDCEMAIMQVEQRQDHAVFKGGIFRYAHYDNGGIEMAPEDAALYEWEPDGSRRLDTEELDSLGDDYTRAAQLHADTNGIIRSLLDCHSQCYRQLCMCSAHTEDVLQELLQTQTKFQESMHMHSWRRSEAIRMQLVDLMKERDCLLRKRDEVEQILSNEVIKDHMHQLHPVVTNIIERTQEKSDDRIWPTAKGVLVALFIWDLITSYAAGAAVSQF